MYYTFPSTDVIIGFETVAYEVNEGQNQVVELCVAVRGGSLETPVEITLVTEDGTALGEGTVDI